LDRISSTCETSFYGTNPTRSVLLVLSDVLLRPLLMRMLLLSNLVITSYCTEQSSSSRADQSSFSGVSRDCAANCT
jgi:hypothetical protein